MAGNTLESLLVWMKDPANNVMQGWDVIAVLGRQRLNELLVQKGIAGSPTDPWLPPIDGSVETIPGKRLDAIRGFVLDAPQLSFENIGADSNHATLSCAVSRGTWCSMSLQNDHWQIQKLVGIDPLLGPRVLLDLNVGRTPGRVSEDNRVLLDLKNSDDCRLTGAGTEDEQQGVGTVFGNLISQLPEEKRIWELGRIEAGTGQASLLEKPQAFRLQAQADPQAPHGTGAASEREGAILVCISMEGQAEGSTIPAGYPYLIPDDAGTDYSACVLFHARTAPLVVLESIGDAFGNHDFVFRENADGTLLGARLMSGALVVPQTIFPTPIPDTTETLDIVIQEIKIQLAAANPFTLSLDRATIRADWAAQVPVEMTINYEPPQTIRFEVGLALHASYTRTDLKWHRTEYTLEKTFIDPANKNWWDDLLSNLAEAIAQGIREGVKEAKAQAISMIGECMDPVFAQTFPVDSSTANFLSEHIKLGLGQVIKGQQLQIPRDLVLFGHVDPTLTSFVVTPLEPRMAAGGRQPFSTVPSVPGVKWSVEAVAGDTAETGSITPEGLYQAPQASMVNGVTRVRVVAEEAATGHCSAALVTVLSSELNISPLIQVCNPDESVELAAASLVAQTLQWSVVRQEGGEGPTTPSSPPSHTFTYVSPPKVEKKTYVLDEVKVTGTGGSRSAWILALQKVPGLVVKPLPSADRSAGELVLQALWADTVVEVEWTLPLGGPGTIDSAGKYTAPEGTAERFVLIFARLQDAIFGDLEGHIILPLPLQEFTDELTLMGEDASSVELLSAEKTRRRARPRTIGTENSLSKIVDWLEDPNNNAMWGWDAVAAMSRDKVNALLLHEYIQRFSSDTYLPPVSGEVPTIANEWTEAIHDFLLDVPRLAFAHDDLGNSHASLTCAILGGTQVTLKKSVDIWEPVKLTRIDPLQGPRLTLDLKLDEVPGVVEGDGRIRLDLKHSDNFILTFAQSDQERRLGGDYFKDLFNCLPDDQRIWTLGSIAAGSDALMRAQSFKLRTQVNPQAEPEGDGAILTFICMDGSSEGGDIPVEYRYLIADDTTRKNYSATVLFAEQRIVRALHVVQSVAEAVGVTFGSEFDYVQDASGRIIKATAKGGSLTTPMSSAKFPPFKLGDQWLTPQTVSFGAHFDANSLPTPLTVVLDGDRNAIVTWKASAQTAVTLELIPSEPAQSPPPAFVAGYKVTFEVTCHYRLDDDGYNLVLRPTLNVGVGSGEIIFATEDGTPIGDLVLQVQLSTLAAAVVVADRSAIESEIKHLLENVLRPKLSVGEFIHESIQLNFNQAIISDSLHAPRDIVAFGRVAPAANLFVVSPQEQLMVVGTAMTFVTDPPDIEVDWKVQGLEAGASENVGAITPNGQYLAPVVGSLTVPFVRVRITATDLASGYLSSALVTVVATPMTLGPVIQICGKGQSVKLDAGVPSGVEVQWDIKNKVEGESGELLPNDPPDSGRTYKAGSTASDKTYVLDEVVISNAQFSTSAWVLVTMKNPMLRVRAVEQAGLSAGQVQLQASVNENVLQVTWTIEAGGPGSIDDNGLYSADPAAGQHFALIFAHFQHPQVGMLQGHIILPLPLTGAASESSRKKR